MKKEQASGFFFVSGGPDRAREDLRLALKQPQMRRVFRRQLAVCNILGPSLATDSRSTEFNEGLRAVGLALARELEAVAPGALATLLAESAADKLNTTARKD